MVKNNINYITDPGFYIWVGVIISFFLFLIYGFFQNHQNEVYRDDMWMRAFLAAGLNPEEIEKITHDDYVWLFDGKSTCVGYGDWQDDCRHSPCYCAGNTVFGNASEQAIAVAEAIRDGGSHPGCPLIYEGSA